MAYTPEEIAKEHIRRSLRAKDIFDRTGAQKELSEACFQLGSLLKSLRRYEEATEAFQQGVEALERMKKQTTVPLKPG